MRSNGRKATREERKLIQQAKLDTYVWLVQKNTPEQLFLIHKDTAEVKIIEKAG